MMKDYSKVSQQLTIELMIRIKNLRSNEESRHDDIALMPITTTTKNGPANLGGNERGRVTGRHQESVVGPELLGKSKIADVEAVRVALGVGVKDVRGFQVPVHHLRCRRRRC